MSTETKPTTAPTEAAKPKAAHGSKSTRITLTSGTTTMHLNAKLRKDGAETFVTTQEKGKASVRGMTAKHATFDAARKVLEDLAAKAEKLGWTRRVAAFGFRAKPDAFTALPTPPKTAGKRS
jgi:hypothetical protein